MSQHRKILFVHPQERKPDGRSLPGSSMDRRASFPGSRNVPVGQAAKETTIVLMIIYKKTTQPGWIADLSAKNCRTQTRQERPGVPYRPRKNSEDELVSVEMNTENRSP